jgi:hypothetical protein
LSIIAHTASVCRSETKLSEADVGVAKYLVPCLTLPLF